jgi:hypothetical protein
MAPQIGPNEAATMLKKPTRLSASPVSASTALKVTAAMVETGREIFGSMVLKLLAPMNAEKQVGTRQAAANRKNITGANPPTLAIVVV